MPCKAETTLESIHVCLGGIESWLLEPKGSIDYINKTFRKKLKSLTDDDIGTKTGETNSPDISSIIGTDICIHCTKPFNSHNRHSHGGYYSSTNAAFRCAQYAGSTIFECKKYTVLKTCNESGKFEKTFTIAKESDQTKLKKFLEFVSS